RCSFLEVVLAGRTLLEKIRNPELAGPRRVIQDSETRESVLRHLREMCTTWQGSMATCPDYGLVDVSELIHAFPDAIAMMAKAIRTSIANYEPRLTNVLIKHVPSETGDLTLRFEISAQIVGGDARNRLKFETSLDTSRKFDVK
ncbi:MAG: type VI secretion system baseplate subunit TssE, partial [Polyangiales bacterium]